MAKPYNLRNVSNVDYRQMNNKERKDKLYPIEIVEREGSRVKIHYVGRYTESSDEWRGIGDIVDTGSSSSTTTTTSSSTNNTTTRRAQVPIVIQPL